MTNPRWNESELLRQTFAEQVEIHFSLASTQNRALELCKSTHVKIPTVVVADRQTAGRGRAEHRWWSPKGALLTSVVVSLEVQPPPSNSVSLLSLTVGAALCDVVGLQLHKAGSREKVGLKWPNDVYVADAKIAGTLIEIPHGQPDSPRAVIGIGLNVNNASSDAPAGLKTKTISLSELTKQPHDLQSVLIQLLHALEARLKQVGSDDTLLTDCNARCLLTGRQVTIQQGQQTIAGTCHGIAADGALLVQKNGAADPTSIYSGTVLTANS